MSLLKPHASLIASSDEDAAPNAPSEAKTLRREPTRQNRHWPMAEVDPGTVGQARHMTSEPRNLNVDHDVLDTLITDARARFDIEKGRGEQADTQATGLTALAAALAIVLANELAHQTATPTVTVSAAIAGLTLFLAVLYALLVRVPGFLLRRTKEAYAQLSEIIDEAERHISVVSADRDGSTAVREAILQSWEARIRLANLVADGKAIDLRWSLMSVLVGATATALTAMLG